MAGGTRHAIVGDSCKPNESRPVGSNSNNKQSYQKAVVYRRRDDNGYRLRAACVCIRQSGPNTEILLVSRARCRSGLLIVPGGGVEDGETAEQAAMREAHEEAGVIGDVAGYIGHYVNESRLHRTDVFILHVNQELPSWEDLHRIGRTRIWLNLESALKRIKRSQRPYLDDYAKQILLQISNNSPLPRRDAAELIRPLPNTFGRSVSECVSATANTNGATSIERRDTFSSESD